MMKCHRCCKAINDSQQSLLKAGRKWHKPCFCCDKCGVNLNSSEFYNDGLDRILCNMCNLKVHGPKKSSYSIGKWVQTQINRSQTVE